MTVLDFSELDSLKADFDDLVLRTPQIDAFCSSSVWILPAQRAYAPQGRPFIRFSEAGFVALMKVRTHDQISIATPLEMGWGLAAPFAGQDPDRMVALLSTAWRRDPAPVDALLLSGLPAEGVWREAITKRFLRTHRVGLGSECCRLSASLEGGMDGFLKRRSAKFRATIRRGWKRGVEQGISFERMGPNDNVAKAFERVLQLEAESWKGQAGEGMDSQLPASFYRDMTQRLQARDALWLLFARHNNRDIGFIFGGVLAGTYRGLQMSFHRDYARWEVGNLMQIALISQLIDAGVHTYDLGTDIPYKRRWAE